MPSHLGIEYYCRTPSILNISLTANLAERLGTNRQFLTVQLKLVTSLVYRGIYLLWELNPRLTATPGAPGGRPESGNTIGQDASGQ